MTSSADVSFTGFVNQVLDALRTADVPYLIGGAMALWAWGEPRTTADLDQVIDLPVESMGALSNELEKRDMLVPVDIMLDLLIEDRADLPINAIHMTSGYKAEMFLLKPGDALRKSSLRRRRLVDLGPSLGEVYVHSPEDLILNKLRFYTYQPADQTRARHRQHRAVPGERPGHSLYRALGAGPEPDRRVARDPASHRRATKRSLMTLTAGNPILDLRPLRAGALLVE